MAPMGAVLRRNEKAKHRIVGLSIETRPDFVDLAEIEHLRELGVTMVERKICGVTELKKQF